MEPVFLATELFEKLRVDKDLRYEFIYGPFADFLREYDLIQDEDQIQAVYFGEGYIECDYFDNYGHCQSVSFYASSCLRYSTRKLDARACADLENIFHGFVERIQQKQEQKSIISPDHFKKSVTVYLAGPMTGIEEYNYPAFFKAEDEYYSRGFKVINPARIGLIKELYDWRDYWPINEAMLRGCDAIVMLEGWEKSPGAVNEYRWAKENGLQAVAFKTDGVEVWEESL